MEERNVEKIHSSELGQELQRREGQVTSTNYGKHLCEQLIHLMDSVTKDDVSPETVNAACNCASQVQKILKLNFDMKKEGF